MKLEKLLGVLCENEAQRKKYAEHAGREVTAISVDSRTVTAGTMFFALSGAKADGHAFVEKAVACGAAFVVSEKPVALPQSVVQFVIPGARGTLARVADIFYGEPTKKLRVTGVTGTNGKTTTTYRIRSVYRAAEHGTGLLGTISYQIGERAIPANNTTPDGLMVQDLFAQMVAEGDSHAVMEVSSHALDMHRVDSVRFKTAVFCSLSGREHLDYHKTIENYRECKARLFEMLPPDGCAVINADDPNGKFMSSRAACRVLTFGIANTADIKAEILDMSMNGTCYNLHTPAGSAIVNSKMVGEFNVMNDLAAAACGIAEGINIRQIIKGLETNEPVPGRLEQVPAGKFFTLVDYAHNEGALDSVCATIRKLAKKRLIVVFGCGGDRDRTKRPAMGAVSEKYADLIFLTADNSRSENPDDIIREIETGMTGCRKRFVLPDREMAIRAAVYSAAPDDVILVAGKGHETYQIFGSTKVPFDDREVLRNTIAERSAARDYVTEYLA